MRTIIHRLMPIVIAILVVAGPVIGGEECTIGVASGRVTADGRPLLWKNRDIPPRYRNNDIRRLHGERYNFLALMTVGYNQYAWAGTNSRGFCLVNAASGDLSGTSHNGPGNGEFLKLALGRCGTVAEFRELLEETNWPGRRTNANFAAIDASGAAVLFEVRNFSFTAFDTNDPKIAPHGFLVRTNFARTANGESGRIRYSRAHALWQAAVKNGVLSVDTVLNQIATDLADDNGAPFPTDELFPDGKHPFAVPVDHTINRGTTSAAVVFSGVKKSESPDLTTMWAVLGQPLLAPCVPVWVKAGEVSSSLSGSEGSPICKMAMKLQDSISYVRAENGKTARYLTTGILPSVRGKLLSLNKKTLEETSAFLGMYRKGQAPDAGQLASFQEQTGRNIEVQYQKIADTALRHQILKVGVYGDEGASPVCVRETVAALEIDGGIVPVVVTGADIQAGALDSLDVIIFPGGSGSKESCSMGARGREKIRKFVLEQGKGCVGICAGGYLLSTSPQYPSSLHLISATVYDSPHYNRGRGLIQIRLTDAGKKIFPELADRKGIFIQYYDGPVLVPAAKAEVSPYTELGEYLTDIHLTGGAEPGVTPGKTAVLFNKAGKGRVFTIVGHPEATPGLRWMVPRMARLVAGKKAISYPKSVVRPGRENKAILFDKANTSREYKLFWKLFANEPAERIQAVDKLIAMRSRPALRWTIGLLRDDSAKVRAHAGEVLAEAEYTPSLSDLNLAVRQEKDPVCRKSLEKSYQKLKSILRCAH